MSQYGEIWKRSPITVSEYTSIIILILYFLPLNITIATVGGKPVDVVPSDFAILLLPIVVITGARYDLRSLLTFSPLLYFIALGFLGAVYNIDGFSSLVSMANFVSPFAQMFVGYWFVRRFGFGSLKNAYKIYLSVFAVIALTDIFLGSFPRGCGYEGRWGGCFLGSEVYGFPNSSMSFLVLGAVLLLQAAYNSVGKQRAALYAAYIAVLLVALLSLSRSSVLVSVLVLMLFLLWVRPVLAMVLIVVAAMAAMLLSVASLRDLYLFSGIFTRFEASLNAGDISTGRFSIWAHTLALIQDSPIIGYAFSQYSQFSNFGTAHQQYLEILFKSGLLGFIVYFAYFYRVVRGFWQSYVFEAYFRHRGAGIALGLFVLGVLVSSLFQPLLTYKPMANAIFFMSGIGLAAINWGRVR